MNSDFHVHSAHSGDSETPMESMIQQAISLGLKQICFTEHYDEDYPAECGDFSLNIEDYKRDILKCKEKYQSKIEVLFGIELGMQPHLGDLYTNYTHSYPFDFIIASQHIVDHSDPYYPAFWKDRVPSDLICRYFEETLESLFHMPEYDTLGHLDYIVRYSGPEKDHFTYQAYADYIDPILKYLIQNGKCLEVNTAGLKYGLGHPNPREDILKRYHELGGELITIGSDAHKPEHLAFDFPILPDLLRSLGFHYYCCFRQRKAEFIPID